MLIDIIFALYGIIQSTIIPYYLLKIYNNQLFNIIIILINVYFLIMMISQYYYKFFGKLIKPKLKYKYYLESSKYFKTTIPISFCLTLIYFGILLHIYIKHDLDSNKFSNDEHHLTKIIFSSLFLFIIILFLTYLYAILAPRG
jgi:hypothetical protein